jgi:hypothetical protein
LTLGKRKNVSVFGGVAGQPDVAVGVLAARSGAGAHVAPAAGEQLARQLADHGVVARQPANPGNDFKLLDRKVYGHISFKANRRKFI